MTNHEKKKQNDKWTHIMIINLSLLQVFLMDFYKHDHNNDIMDEFLGNKIDAEICETACLKLPLNNIYISYHCYL